MDLTSNADNKKYDHVPWSALVDSPMEKLLGSKSLEGESFPVLFERGQCYAQDGHVLTVELFLLSIRALVAGGGYEPYVVELHGASRKDGGFFIDSADCTCPFHTGLLGSKSLCKHQVAAGLIAGSRYVTLREAAQIGAQAPDPATHQKSGPRL